MASCSGTTSLLPTHACPPTSQMNLEKVPGPRWPERCRTSRCVINVYASYTDDLTPSLKGIGNNLLPGAGPFLAGRSRRCGRRRQATRPETHAHPNRPFTRWHNLLTRKDNSPFPFREGGRGDRSPVLPGAPGNLPVLVLSQGTRRHPHSPACAPTEADDDGQKHGNSLGNMFLANRTGLR